MQTDSLIPATNEPVSAAPVRVQPVVSSKLVGKQKWGKEVCGCWSCGFQPVRLEVTFGSDGIKRFCYTCPNVECGAASKSPPNEAWKTSKAEAADYWIAANTVVNQNP